MIAGKVGPWELQWVTIPHGLSGDAHVLVKGPGVDPQGEQIAVSWKRDADGIWIELPYGVHGYDLDGDLDDAGSLKFHVAERLSDSLWEGVSFIRAGEEHIGAADSGKKKSMRVRAQMPGKIVRVLVKAGAEVEKDQPLLVMEAMKMENEIRAPGPGRIKDLKVIEGQAVETGADLILME